MHATLISPREMSRILTSDAPGEPLAGGLIAFLLLCLILWLASRARPS